jgi:uncharacterized coiled-coil DUF342 family protein
MSLPPEINAIRYYELEIKARGFDILQELEVINERVSMLKNEKNKVFNDLQSLYKQAQEQNEANIEVSKNNNSNIEKNRVKKTVHEISNIEK